MKGIILFLSLMFISNAHICSIYPHQRGDLNISIPGHDSCYRRSGYCGGIEFKGKKTAFLAGSQATFLIQQNLNHWNATNPGYIDVSISYKLLPTPQDWTVLATIDDYPAFDQVTQTNFSIVIRIPNKAASHAIIRFRYQSNNLDEVDKNTTIFFNCADIQIISNSRSHEEEINDSENSDNQLLPNLKKFSCNTPLRWSITAVELNQQLGYIEHKIYYDVVNNRTRWERTGYLESSSQKSTLILINNYNTLIEYVIDPNMKTCSLYGSDMFYGWNYGVSGMNYVGIVHQNKQILHEWSNPTNLHKWLATQKCEPYAHILQQTSIIFGQAEYTNFPANTFTPPSFCSGELVQLKGCSPRTRAIITKN